MAKYVFDQCCFCIDLRVGCFIIGYLNLIGSLIATIGSIVLLVGGAVLSTSSEEEKKTAGAGVLVVAIITLLVVALLLAFAIVLLVGLHKHKPGHVKAYLIYCYVFLVISLLMLIINLTTGPIVGKDIASRVIGLLFSIYFVMVIRSYYHKMLEEPKTSAHYNS